MSQLIIRGRKVVGGVAEGKALVTSQSISTWGGVHALKGIITERRHELNGQKFKNKVLVFPSAKGSSGWSTVSQVIRIAGPAPAAMLINEIDSLTAMGAVVLHSPAMTDFDRDPISLIKTGDWVRVDADKGIIEVTSDLQK